MNVEYKKFVNEYDPVCVGWKYAGKDVLLQFSQPITAVFSEKIGKVVVEIYSENKLNFYNINGKLECSNFLPTLENYQFRGINKSIESKTGISFLFHPISQSVGNKWRDTEQYEMDLECVYFLGKKLGIYR